VADERTDVGPGRFVRASNDDQIDESFAQEVTESWREAFNAHDGAAHRALLAQDVHFEDSAFYGGVAHGREQVVAALEAGFRALPDARLDGPEVFVSLDRRKVAVSWKLTGTHLGPLDPPGFAPTGARIEAVGFEQFEFRGGLISRALVRWDMGDIARQIGAAPEPGSRGERVAVGLQRLTARGMRKKAGS